MKRTLRKVLTAHALSNMWSPLTSNRVTIFTLHRFDMPDLGVSGHSPSLLRSTLERLRRDRYELIDLEDAILQLQEPSAQLRRAVVFTVDDGYVDAASVGADAFLAFDCPVTVFLSTGFVSGELWHWWDQIEYICNSTGKDEIAIDLAERALHLSLNAPNKRGQAVSTLWEYCKHVPEETKLDFISRLAETADVPVPGQPPRKYTAMTWDDVRALESRGVRFGPHGVSHPVLARATDDGSKKEISNSWANVKRATARPVPIFAYPNGSSGDFGSREIKGLKECGLIAAVTTIPGYARRESIGSWARTRYQLPRFAYPNEVDRVLFLASGISRLIRSAGVVAAK